MNFIENETPEKLRGGYYTDSDIATFLVRWAAEIAPERVLEPSCGDGAFFGALADVGIGSLREVVACELLGAEATKARTRATKLPKRVSTTVLETDFLAWALPRLRAEPIFDAVVGNPPFVRYQYLEAAQQDRARQVFDRFGLPFTKHTNAWVPFVIASIALLRPGGRLAMVVPAELLHVLHAQSLRTHLQRTCSRLLVLDPAELWFKETLQGVVLLLAEKSTSDRDVAAELAINSIRGRSFLSDAPACEFKRANFIASGQFGGKWMAGLLSEEERGLLDRLRASGSVRPFQEIAHVAVGIVTGANKFFLVTDETVDDFSLNKFAHPMFGRSEHVPGVIYDERAHEHNRQVGLPTNFLRFDTTRKSDLPAGPRRYIDAGEAAGLHTRYKCRIREPWYSVPSVFSAPVGMLKRSHDHPRMVLNSAGAYTTDTAYRISPINCMSAEQLVFSSVNSLTALSAELEGRHYGGGVLELVPSEINKLLVPYAPKIRPALRRLDGLFRSGAPAADILAVQDAAVLHPLGLSDGDCEKLRGAWSRLRLRRQRISIDPEVVDESD
jgi:adenine-specific DNA-methyltransferase